MKIALRFTYDTDIIKVPKEYGTDAKKLQDQFDKWLYDKNNDHGFWISKKGKYSGVTFNSDSFVDYLNNHVREEGWEKVTFIERKAQVIPKDIKVLYF